jgi:hypothetical protein
MAHIIIIFIYVLIIIIIFIYVLLHSPCERASNNTHSFTEELLSIRTLLQRVLTEIAAVFSSQIMHRVRDLHHVP